MQNADGEKKKTLRREVNSRLSAKTYFDSSLKSIVAGALTVASRVVSAL